MIKKILCVVLTGLMGAALQATQPVRVVFDSYHDFASGNSRSVTLSDDGMIAAAPTLKQLAEIKADQIWCLLAEQDGAYLVGSSPEGRLYRVLTTGQVSEVAKFEGTHIYALAKNARGEIFVAVTPEGKIYKLGAKGAKPTVYFDTKQKYIWALAFDKAGHLFVGTGLEGKIYQVTGQDKGEVFYDSDEVHIRSLCFDLKGQLWAGSADGGLLYRIAPNGEAVVMASTGKQEVNRVALAKDGTIYFTATGTAKSNPPIPKSTFAAGSASLPSVVPPSGDAEDALRLMATQGSKQGGAPSASKSTESGGLSQLWRIGASLFPEALWNTRETILTLDPIDKGAYVGTASEGYYYRIDERGRATRWCKVEASALSATFPLGEDRLLLATSNPARLYQLGTGRSDPSIYESRVIDSGLFARWGAVRAEGTGKFNVRTRSGNTPKPDKSWHPWIATDEEQAKSPPARYLQYELNLDQGSVDRVEVVYLPRNVAPKLELIEILPPGLGYWPIIPPPTPAQAKSSDQLLQQNSRSENEVDFRPQVRFLPAESRGLRTVTWKATDVNSDDLQFTVSYRAKGSEIWRVLAKEIHETVLSWDTSGWPDGHYYLKIKASDELTNAASDASSDELESKMFFVDNTAPVVRIVSNSQGRAVFTVTEESSGLRSVTISRDGKEFLPIRPVDGILDSRQERFETTIGKGEVLFIRAEDQAGNVSSAQAES